jgi:membrane-bound lytic murein transglycosylase B
MNRSTRRFPLNRRLPLFLGLCCALPLATATTTAAANTPPPQHLPPHTTQHSSQHKASATHTPSSHSKSATHAAAHSTAHASASNHGKTSKHKTVAKAPAVVRHYETLPEVHSYVDTLVQKDGFNKDELLALFAKARFQPGVIKAILPPSSPRQKSWQAYRARFIEPVRIKAGLKFWDTYGDRLREAEQRYGVPADIIAAIIGVETIYGRNTGTFETFSALTTLAFDYPPRADLFRRELEALLLLARDEGRSPLSYQGSYAGALGLPQFLPSSLRKWAVDFDGDHHIDLTNPVDAIGSVGRFLAEHGWETGAPIAVPVTVNEGPGIDTLIAEGIEPKRPASELRAYGVQVGDAPNRPAALIDLVTPDDDTEYRLGYRNFYVITRYNRSSFYASSVMDLAEALKAARSDRP